MNIVFYRFIINMGDFSYYYPPYFSERRTQDRHNVPKNDLNGVFLNSAFAETPYRAYKILHQKNK